LELTDYGARLYDSQIGRWTATDPLADKYVPVTSYGYTLNNPISIIDIDGRDVSDAGGPLGRNEIHREGFYDDIRVDTKTKKVIVNPTDDNFDRIFVNGKFVGIRAKGTSIDILITNGFQIIQGPRIEGVGMGATDMGIATVSGSVILKLVFAATKLGDLTSAEVQQIQKTVDEAGRPIEVGGSAASGTRRGVGSDLPIGKGEGTKSDIDYLAPPNSIKYFEDTETQLPGLDPNSGIIPGTGNPYIGPYIRFEPNAKPVTIPYIKPN
jgi:hypothetical protein